MGLEAELSKGPWMIPEMFHGLRQALGTRQEHSLRGITGSTNIRQKQRLMNKQKTRYKIAGLDAV